MVAATGALPGEALPSTDPDYHVLEDVVEKPTGAESELLVENFQRVPASEVSARADHVELVAHRPVYPVLMLEYRHEDIFRYGVSQLGDSPATALAAHGAT